MTTRYTCHAIELSEEPISYDTDTHLDAAEQYVNENLEFDQTDPQDLIEVEVEYPHPEFENKKETKNVLVSIQLEWTANAKLPCLDN